MLGGASPGPPTFKTKENKQTNKSYTGSCQGLRCTLLPSQQHVQVGSSYRNPSQWDPTACPACPSGARAHLAEENQEHIAEHNVGTQGEQSPGHGSSSWQHLKPGEAGGGGILQSQHQAALSPSARCRAWTSLAVHWKHLAAHGQAAWLEKCKDLQQPWGWPGPTLIREHQLAERDRSTA